jgi:hypothetical protein
MWSSLRATTRGDILIDSVGRGKVSRRDFVC